MRLGGFIEEEEEEDDEDSQSLLRFKHIGYPRMRNSSSSGRSSSISSQSVVTVVLVAAAVMASREFSGSSSCNGIDGGVWEGSRRLGSIWKEIESSAIGTREDSIVWFGGEGWV